MSTADLDKVIFEIPLSPEALEALHTLAKQKHRGPVGILRDLVTGPLSKSEFLEKAAREGQPVDYDRSVRRGVPFTHQVIRLAHVVESTIGQPEEISAFEILRRATERALTDAVLQPA